MAEGNGRDEPDLELPSLFGRKRKSAPSAADSPAAAKWVPPTPPPARRRPPTPPPSVPPSRLRSAAEEPTADAEPETSKVTEAVAARGSPERPPQPTAPPPRRRGPEMSWTAAAGPSTSTASSSGPVADDPAEQPAPTPEDEPTPRRSLPSLRSSASLTALRQRIPRRSRTMRSSARAAAPLTGRVAAGVTGAIVIVVGLALLWAALQGCTAVRGVSSCGGVGLLAIAATLVVQVLLGAVLLAAWRVGEPRSTSLLGVGLFSTVAMVLIYASTPTVWLSGVMLVVGPAAYVVAQGVTSARIDVPDDADLGQRVT